MSRHTPELHRLAELGKTSGGFLHDMVNHMTAITLSIDYFEQRALKDSELLRCHALQAASVRKSIEQFAEGVRAHMKHGGVRCFFSPIAEIRAVVDVFRYRAEKEHIEIAITGNDTLTIYGNRLKFTQIISNILSNAIDATRHATHVQTISISCDRRDDFVAISITDSGCGIPEHVQKKLFTPFVTTKENRGTGLGLTSVKKIIEEDFSGRIEIETAVQTGTTVSLLFRTKIGSGTKN